MESIISLSILTKKLDLMQFISKRYNLVKSLLILLVLLLSNSILSQNLSFSGVLPALNVTTKFSDKLSFNFFTSTTIDAFSKQVNNIEYPSSDLQLYIQPSVIFNTSGNWNYSFSYTYQRNNPFRSIFTNEHRLWEQALYTKKYSKFKLTNRFRFEERFIENKQINRYPLSTRIRYQIGFSAPFNKNAKLYYTGYNEFYFSLSGPKNAIYSENWTYLGFGASLSNRSKFEVGYLFQTLVRNLAKDLRFLNLVQLTWIYTLGITKNTK